MSNVRFIGLDVHAETIAVAVAEPAGEVRSLGVIPNRLESIRKLVKKLGPVKQLARVLRGRAHGVRGVLAADGARGDVRGRGADVGARQSRRSGQDRPSRRAEAGAELSGRRLDAGVGARRGARSAARSRPRARGGEEGPAPRAPSVGQISAAARPPPADRR